MKSHDRRTNKELMTMFRYVKRKTIFFMKFNCHISTGEKYTELTITWEPEVIASCITLHWTYIYIHRSKLMLLPSVYTLRSYVVKSTGDVGITPVKKKKN
jgi:hypothetical protein